MSMDGDFQWNNGGFTDSKALRTFSSRIGWLMEYYHSPLAAARLSFKPDFQYQWKCIVPQTAGKRVISDQRWFLSWLEKIKTMGNYSILTWLRQRSWWSAKHQTKMFKRSQTKKVWMTSLLFSKWTQKHCHKFTVPKWKIAMVLEYCCIVFSQRIGIHYFCVY